MFLELCLLFFSLIFVSKSLDTATPPSALSRVELDPNIGYKILRNPEEDVFPLLSEATLQKFWSFEEQLSIDERLRALKNIQEPVYIKILLVGFQSQFSMMTFNPSELEAFVSHLNVEEPNHIIHVMKEFSHESSVSKKYEFQVSTPPNVKELRTQLKTAHQAAMSKLEDGKIPLEGIDEVIRAHHRSSGDMSYSIYLLNFFSPTEPKPNSLDYLYHAPSLFPSSSSREDMMDCGSTMWAGTNDRYLWIDVGAGPHSYGPRTSGEGGVTTASLPYFPRYLVASSTPEGSSEASSGGKDKVPLSKLPTHRPISSPSLRQKQSLWNDFPKTKFSLDLISLLKRTTDHLISPSIHRYPVHIWRELTLHLVMFHDHPLGYPEKYDYFSWKQIQANILRQVPIFQHQKIKFNFTEHSLLECSECSTILIHSRKEHTSTTYKDRNSHLHSHVHSFIDSAEIHHLLDKHKHLLVPGLEEGNKKAESLVIPIFLFDFSFTNIMLLDRQYQSISFPDMVVSIQTDAPRMLFDEVCNTDYAGVDPQDASRATLASILTTVWSVPPTEIRWSPERNGTSRDLLWSVTNTPFGVFSTSMELSFSQRDSAARNPIYFLMDRTIRRIHSLLDHFSAYDKELSEVLSASEHLSFVRRWNFLQYKLEQAKSKLASHNYNNSMSYVISLQHDLHALHELVHEAGAKLSSYYVCKKGSTFTWFSILNYIIKFSSIFGSLGTLIYLIRVSHILSFSKPSKPKAN